MRRLTIEHVMMFVSLASILIVTAIFTQQSYKVLANPQQFQSGNHTFGVISSIQNDESGQPAWVVSGHWTSALMGNNPVNASQATANTTAPFGGSRFDMQIEMVRFDGSAGHTHSITNFVT